MSELNLKPIDVLEHTIREIFQEQYLKPAKPVIMKDFSKDWAARENWTIENFKKNHGDLMVPVYKDAFANTGTSYTSKENKMRFGDYLDSIAAGPTQYRMFLFNIFKHIPALCKDFTYPDIIDRYVKGFPFMFFGGQTAWVDVHYDLDLSHLFLTQFHGRKRVILFGPECSDYLYRHPLTVSCNVDLRNPDFDRYPRIKDIQGYECILEEGDTLFMPSGYWHFIDYVDGGFSVTLRARPEKLPRRLYSYLKIFNLGVLDNTITKALGAKRWYAMKEKMAVRKAEKLP